MGDNISVYFRDQDSEQLDWVDQQVEEGNFRNRAAVIISCIKYTRENYEEVEEYV